MLANYADLHHCILSDALVILTIKSNKSNELKYKIQYDSVQCAFIHKFCIWYVHCKPCLQNCKECYHNL